MGKYTLRGSPGLDARIDADLSRISEAVRTSRYGALYRALVLIGGYGRGEGTPYIVDGMQRPFNDYDLVVVSAPLGRSRRSEVQADLRRWEATLTAELKLPVDLCLYPENVLRTAEFSLLNYEMRYGHRGVWGEPDLIALMPAYGHDAIPLSEGTRLLMNRGKLLLDVRRALRKSSSFTPEDRIRYVKFLFKAQLAFGDCALLAASAYDLSYAVKRERIGRVDCPGIPDREFMVEGFRKAVAFKEWGDFSGLDPEAWRGEFERVRRYFVEFFTWYEARRLGGAVDTAERHVTALGKAGRECGLIKAGALNLMLCGARAAGLGGKLLPLHPRARLYLALPRLLADSPPVEELAGILAAGAASLEAAEERFYRLQKRVS